MSPRATAAVARRVLRQLRRDPRTVALLVVVPSALVALLWWVYSARPGPNMLDTMGPALIAFLPFTMMFIVTSVTMLRERTSGTLERMLAMPTGKADILLGYALALAVVCVLQAGAVIAVAVYALGMEVGGPTWALLVVALADSPRSPAPSSRPCSSCRRSSRRSSSSPGCSSRATRCRRSRRPSRPSSR
jgi:ABC-2 type transport system permease protein